MNSFQRLTLALVAAVLFTILGIGAKDVLGPAYREVRAEIIAERVDNMYHDFALELEELWTCADVLGIDETRLYPEVLAVIVEFTNRDMSCINGSGTWFYQNIEQLLIDAKEAGGFAEQFIVCVRGRWERPGFCWTPDDTVIDYPDYLNMWVGRGV